MKKLLLSLVLISVALAQQPHGSASLTWSWSQGTGDPATGFHVWRSTTAGGPYTTVGTVPVGTLTYLDAGLTIGATYFYTVSAYNPAGDSSKSGEVTCVVPFQIPGAPSTLSVVAK